MVAEALAGAAAGVRWRRKAEAGWYAFGQKWGVGGGKNEKAEREEREGKEKMKFGLNFPNI